MNLSRIAPKLWQGGAPRPERGDASELRRLGFQVLVLCAKEHQPRADQFPGLVVVHAPFDDDPRYLSTAAEKTARDAARIVAQFVARWQRVLTTCAMGINRSGFVNAWALHLLIGRSGAECIRIVRAGRGADTLWNPQFVKRLEALPSRAEAYL
jgi:protein-tyrosine phosphatase